MSRWVQHPALPSSEVISTSLKDRKTLGLHALAALLILFNWLTFVWAVMNNHVLDASMGYYICPLVVVMLGVVLLRERLSKLKWIAVGLAAFGVSYTALSKGTVLWVPLTIAFSFGFYGLVKKKAKLSSLAGLTFETGFLVVPALAYLAWRCLTAEESILGSPWWVYVLLFGSGLATLAPLAFYASAVKHLPLSTVGFLQYIGPTIQFLAGILVLGESLDYTRLIGFCFAWFGVLLFLFSMSRGMTVDAKLKTAT
jgi:chloramphenicol-sensitive protein RarD